MTIEDILQAFSRQGSSVYYGEPVTLSEHCLQTAHFAALAGASEALIAAALLHDVGHLLGHAPEQIADWQRDAQHELVGSRLLEGLFPPQVTEPIRLHVAAKRYLCATDPAYLGQLSAASLQTLRLQRGAMSVSEIQAFEAQPFRADALLLRRCDDQGKLQGLRTPDILHYRPLLQRLAC